MRTHHVLGSLVLLAAACSSAGTSDTIDNGVAGQGGESGASAGATGVVGGGGGAALGGSGGSSNGGSSKGGSAGAGGSNGGASAGAAGGTGGAGANGATGGSAGATGGTGNGGGAAGGQTSFGGSAGTGGSGVAGTGNGGTGVAGTNATGGSGTGGSGIGMQLIYAHTDTTLFQLDPTSPNLALTQIGDFDCIGGTGQDTAMTDLAVSKTGDLWGISANHVMPLTIQGSTVHCGTLISLQNPKGVKFYGLTFAPAGVLDPSNEVLVAGNTDGQLWSIDSSGNLVQRGVFGNVPADDGQGHSYPNTNVGNAWELSGDIVFLANGGDYVGFATVRDCPNPPSTANCNSTNTLLEIDVKALGNGSPTTPVTLAVRGQIVKSPSCSDPTTSFGNFYGIAAWNADVYGFSRSGDLVTIDVKTGGGCLVQSYPGDKFAGAGVTTLAPVIKP